MGCGCGGSTRQASSGSSSVTNPLLDPTRYWKAPEVQQAKAGKTPHVSNPKP